MQTSFLFVLLTASLTVEAQPPHGAVGSLFAPPPDDHPAGVHDAVSAVNVSAAAALQSTGWIPDDHRNFQPDLNDQFREVPPLTQRLMELAMLQNKIEILRQKDEIVGNHTSSFKDPIRAERHLRAQKRRLQGNFVNDLLSIWDLLNTGAGAIGGIGGTGTTTRSPVQKVSNGLQSMILGAQDISAGLTEIYGTLLGGGGIFLPILPGSPEAANNAANGGTSITSVGNEQIPLSASPHSAAANTDLESLLIQLAQQQSAGSHAGGFF